MGLTLAPRCVLLNLCSFKTSISYRWLKFGSSFLSLCVSLSHTHTHTHTFMSSALFEELGHPANSILVPHMLGKLLHPKRACPARFMVICILAPSVIVSPVSLLRVSAFEMFEIWNSDKVVPVALGIVKWPLITPSFLWVGEWEWKRGERERDPERMLQSHRESFDRNTETEKQVLKTELGKRRETTEEFEKSREERQEARQEPGFSSSYAPACPRKTVTGSLQYRLSLRAVAAA